MKAVLVVNIPNGYGDIHDNKAIVKLRNDKLGTSLKIYNVPLRQLPEKESREMVVGDPFGEGCCIGWNACLDEITGDYITQEEADLCGVQLWHDD